MDGYGMTSRGDWREDEHAIKTASNPSSIHVVVFEAPHCLQ